MKRIGPLAFFGTNDDPDESAARWTRIGRAIKNGDHFECEKPIAGFRYIKMEEEAKR